jgi:short-subunit dehydrogenase
MIKVAIVTGASKGIGRATVIKLKNLGFRVVSVARSLPEIGDLKFSCDVSNKDQVEYVINKTIENFNKIDVLINNAGFGIYGNFDEVKLNQIEYLIRTNFLGPIYFMKAVIPYMKKQGGGSIINVISEAAYIPIPKLSVYSATKAALSSLTNALHLELKKYNIRVSGIYPGPVKTNFTYHPSFGNNTPWWWKFAIEPENVADMIVKALRTGKREIYVPSKLKIEPYFLKLSFIMQTIVYKVLSKFYK